MTNFIHGLHDTPEFRVWANIKQRCLNPNNPGYKDYGGRGITICDKWIDSFEAFYQDVGPKPSPNHSIERNDVNGHYEPGNCRWATMDEQANNKRTNVYHSYQGELLTEAQLARKVGLSQNTLRGRISRDVNLEKPVVNGRPSIVSFTYRGETKTLKEWSIQFGLSYSTLYSRIFTLGKSFEEAITIDQNYVQERRYLFNGQEMTIAQISKMTGIKYNLLYNRLVALGWAIDKATKT